MTPADFKCLGEIWETPRTISVRDLDDHTARTLLWGYTSGRNDFHVYIRKRKLHIYCYDYNGVMLHYASGTELPLEGIVPDKRLCPEACDYVFCRRLKERGIALPFTTWDPTRLPSQFHGRIYDADAAKP